MASLHNAKLYTGHGQSGVWGDPANWTNGVVPGAADLALIQTSAVLNGSIEVGTLMLLGTETVTIDGQVKTDSTNTCESFMVCDQAVANFAAGSSMLDAGGFETGVEGVGLASIAGAGGGKAAAVVNSVVMKIGQFAAGVGTLSVAGVLNNAGGAYVGLYGQGTLDVTGSGQCNFASGLALGDHSGATGVLNVSGNAVVDASMIAIGMDKAGAPGGTAAATIADHAVLSAATALVVGNASVVTLTGGTLLTGSVGNGVVINPGGTVSGYGTIASAVHGVTDNGVLASAGGTLLVTGNVSGMGVAQIGGGSTLDLVASRITLPSINFLGSAGTLDLTAGVSGNFAVGGFGVGDQIVMAGIDGASWNGVTDVLSLSEHGQVIDKLTLSGVAASAAFHVNPGGIVSMLPVMVGTHH